MKNKVIFLDIDGVLNTESWRNSTEEYFEKPISEEKMPLVKYIVDVTGSKIVLSSSYRQYWNEGAQQASKTGKYFNEIFAKYGMKIHSKTRWLPGNNRRLEIEAWIGEHDSQISNYVVIDDIDYGFDEHFVKTSDETGLDEEACERAIKILNGEDYATVKNVDLEWQQVREILKDAVGEAAFNIWFKKLKAKEYFPKSNMLFLSCHSFSRRIIEDSEQFSDVLDRAIRMVFGDDIEYQIEDEDIGENDVGLLVTDKNTDTVVRKKIVYDPYSAYKNPEIRAYKTHEHLRKVFDTKPEHIFKSKNIHSELLFRLLLIFMNASELIGITDLIQVSRRGGNYIEIYSNDCTEFLIDKVKTEKDLFRNSDYDRFVIRNYDKKKRYLPAPFHIRSSVKGIGADEDFYANSDSYFTLFSLIHMVYDVRIESVKDGQYHCVKYERGINSKGIEEGETNKKNGTYITYTAPDEEELTNDEICDILETVSILSGVKTSFFDPDKGDMLSYNYKNSGVYLDKCLPSKNKSFFSKVKGGGRDRYNDSYYNAKVEVGFQLAQSKGFSKSFYNYSLLPEDNVFISEAHMLIAEELNRWLDGRTKQKLTADDVKENCSVVINIKTDCDYEAWEIMRAEPVKARRMINDMIEDVFDSFLYWLGGRDHVELLNLVFDIFKNKDKESSDVFFPMG